MDRTSAIETSAASGRGSCSSRTSWRRTSRRASAPSRSARSRRPGSASDSQGRRAPLKSALLDQRTVAGLGNIYVDEALWQSRLHPLRVAGSLDADELGRLYRAVRSVLRKAIERQGSTLRDYALPDGALRHDAGRVPRLRARGRAVRPLRTTAHADRGRWARDDVLPALPDSAGMTPEARFDELLETARADESILGPIF